MRRSLWNSCGVSAVLAALAALSAPALAQEAEEDSGEALVLSDVSAESDEMLLPEIVVTGTKTSRSFTETAASVSVVDSTMIDQQGGADLRDVFSLLGNVNYNNGGSGNAGFTIRGLSAEGVTESSNSAPLTALIIDGTTQTIETMRRGARGLWDVEQVEVFRGPQSTLQGRGALAGAVIVETKDPTPYYEADFRGVYGNLDRREAAFAVSGPVIEDVLAIRLAGEYRMRDRGIGFNIADNELFGEDNYNNLRGKVLFTPAGAPGLSFLLTVSDSYDKPGLSVSNSTDFYDRQYNTGSNSAVEAREAENLNISLESSYDFGNGMAITSVTSYLDAETTIFTPQGNLYSRNAGWKDKNLTQDLRLTFGDYEGSKFSGVAGLFYGHFTQPRGDLMRSGTAVIQDITADNETTSVSAYAAMDWRFASDWSLLAGGRVTYERVKNNMQYCGIIFSAVCPANSPTGVVNNAQGATSDIVFLPRLGLTYHISDHQTISATASRGYRSGFIAIQDRAGPTKVKPEYMDSFELAYRVEDPDRQWRFGATGFYSRYTDQQIVVGRPSATTVPRTENAGESEMYGAELEGSYAFESGLSVFGSVGLLKTNILDFQSTRGNLKGNEFPDSPQITAGLGVEYQHHSGFFGSAMASYSGGFYSTGSVDNDPMLKVSDFAFVNARLGYRHDNWELVGYVDNVFDNDYVTSLSGTSYGAPPTEAVVSEPRTYGVELRVFF
ncbi:MAG: TonB-dependent receptor [Pikeienuella sp.]